MSIRGAVGELNNEIQRLTEIRDSLVQAESDRGVRGPGLMPVATKSAVAKKTATPKKKAAPVKAGSAKKTTVMKQRSAGKRVVSDATRKKMSDAAKARTAAKKAIPGK